MQAARITAGPDQGHKLLLFCEKVRLTIAYQHTGSDRGGRGARERGRELGCRGGGGGLSSILLGKGVGSVVSLLHSHVFWKNTGFVSAHEHTRGANNTVRRFSSCFTRSTAEDHYTYLPLPPTC